MGTYNGPSDWPEDKLFERASVEYLFQSGHLRAVGLRNIELIEDRTLQKLGVDLYADIVFPDGSVAKHKAVDVKSIAQMIPTFSQEVCNTTSGKIGWLCNEGLLTEYYLFVWHDLRGEWYGTAKKKMADCVHLKKDGTPHVDVAKVQNLITRNSMALVSKAELKNIIFEETGRSCTSDDAVVLRDYFRSHKMLLDKKASEISEKEGKPGKLSVLRYALKDKNLSMIQNGQGHDVWLTYSPGIHERPVNFVVRKRALENGAIAHMTVSA